VADDFRNQIPKSIASLPLYERIADNNIQSPNGARKELVLLRVFYESMNWKNNLTERYENIAPLKYEFESKSLFIIDNINYTNSKDSILNQVADFMLYILRKVIEVKNGAKKIENSNLSKLVEEIYDRLSFSMKNNDIRLETTDGYNILSFDHILNTY
jgi:hypothetical protein